MKKRCALLAALLLLTALPVQALAAEEETAVRLTIDNAHVYSGMDKAYQDGYTPTVENGVAKIVLPLLANGELSGSKITVTPGLGDTSSSPFVFKNYEKTVPLQDNPVGDGTTTVSSYLVVLELALSANRVNGVYPVMVGIQAQSGTGSAISASFTCYVTICDGKDPNADSSAESSPAAQSQPKVIVSGYNVSASPVEAGSEFSVAVTLRNTSEKRSVKNMTVTVTCESMNFVLLNESNVFYIKSLGKGETEEIELRYRTDLETPPQRYVISIAMEYDNSDAQTLASSGTVLVEVAQPLRVELQTPKVAEQVNAGDTMSLSFQVMNLGRCAIYNVRVELEAPGMIPTSTAFIGNMEAGTSATSEMDVFIGTRNMTGSGDGEEKYGPSSGNFILTYEDEKGAEYTQEAEFYTTIEEPVIAASSNTEPEETEKASQWWISVLIGGLAVASLTVFVVIRGKRKGKEHEDD